MAARDVDWHATSESNQSQTMSMQVVAAVADAEGVAPRDVEPPLYAAVDPDALDQLFSTTATSPRITGHVEFEYAGYTVHIDGTGQIRLDPDTASE